MTDSDASRNASFYPPIESYGVVGDLRTVALVGPGARIDQLCWPQFDSPSVFAGHLDRMRGGHFAIEPKLGGVRELKLYFPGTNILLSRFLSEEGIAEVSDFMYLSDDGDDARQALVRRAKAVHGRVRFELRCAPRFDYARGEGAARLQDGAVVFEERGAGGLRLRLRGEVPLSIEGGDAAATFELDHDQSALFVLDEPGAAGGAALALDSEAFKTTANAWRQWVGRCQYRGRWQEMVQRSALALKLLVSREHGSIVAAPTFGFPNDPGGERNWDYRRVWLRDAAFTVYAFMRLGYTEEAKGFMRWLEDRIEELDDGEELKALYRLDGSPVRGGSFEFLYSRVMRWVAVDRAIRLARKRIDRSSLGRPGMGRHAGVRPPGAARLGTLRIPLPATAARLLSRRVSGAEQPNERPGSPSFAESPLFAGLRVGGSILDETGNLRSEARAALEAMAERGLAADTLQFSLQELAALALELPPANAASKSPSSRLCWPARTQRPGARFWAKTRPGSTGSRRIRRRPVDAGLPRRKFRRTSRPTTPSASAAGPIRAAKPRPLSGVSSRSRSSRTPSRCMASARGCVCRPSTPASTLPAGRRGKSSGAMARDRLAQAKADFQWGEDSLDHGHFAQTCFIAQQVVEKALKAIAYARDYAAARGHSAFEIVSDLGLNGDLRRAAQVLDQYYIATRYPDAMPSGNPSLYHTEEQARDALEKTRLFLGKAEEELNGV